VPLPPAAAATARRRTRRKAQKKGRTPSAATLALADWVCLIITLEAATWPLADVVRLYRACWHIALICKRMKQLLCLAQLRSRHPASVEATVRALLVAWALQEETATTLRALLPTGTALPLCAVVSSGLRTGLCLDTLPREAVPDMPDRIIAATALHLHVPLISRDRHIQMAGITTIW
jgi:predicted nucleic acid-binding protein